MNENEEKDLALKEKRDFEEQLKKDIKELKEGQSTVLNGLRITNVKGNYTIKFDNIDIEFGIIDKDGNLTYNKENFIEAKKALEEQGITLEELGLPDIEEWIDEQEKQKEDEQKVEEQEGEKIGEEEDLSKEKEVEEPEEPEEEKKKENKDEKEQRRTDNNQLKGRTVQKLNMDRKITDSQSLREWIKVNLHVAPEEVYRVQKNTHDYAYIGKNGDKYTELPLNTRREGRNTTQQINVVHSNGKVEKTMVHSLMLRKDGEFGIATKGADAFTNTDSFVVRRTDSGEYFATKLIEDSGANKTGRDIPGGKLADTEKTSSHDVEEFLEDKEEMKNANMDITKDGTTYKEIVLYGYFKEKGYTPDAIDRMIKDINENEIYPDEAEKNEKEFQEQLKREEASRNRNDDDGQKVKGPRNSRLM